MQSPQGQALSSPRHFHLILLAQVVTKGGTDSRGGVCTLLLDPGAADELCDLPQRRKQKATT